MTTPSPLSIRRVYVTRGDNLFDPDTGAKADKMIALDTNQGIYWLQDSWTTKDQLEDALRGIDSNACVLSRYKKGKSTIFAAILFDKEVPVTLIKLHHDDIFSPEKSYYARSVTAHTNPDYPRPHLYHYTHHIRHLFI